MTFIRKLIIFSNPAFKYTPPILSFTLFLILIGLSWIFAWLAMAMGLIFILDIKKTKMVKVEERDTKAEVLIV